MHFSDVAVETIVDYLPPVALSSDEIEARLAPLYERLHLPTGRLELMTGIRTRRFWEEPMSASGASTLAGKRAMERSGIAPEKIDLLVHCAVCRDRLEPATATTVHAALGLPSHTQVLDVSNACLGFLNGMILAAGLIQGGQIQAALLVSGENGKPLLDRTLQTLLHGELTRRSVKPYFANLTIGAGAAAAVLCHASLAPADAPRMQSAIAATDTRHNDLCHGDSSGDGLEMLTESELLLEAGIDLATRAWELFLGDSGWTRDAVDRVICHQVGRVHQRRLLEAIGVPESKDSVTYPELGNIGSAALPVTLAQALHKGIVQSGDRVALLGIGSGLSSIMVALQA